MGEDKGAGEGEKDSGEAEGDDGGDEEMDDEGGGIYCEEWAEVVLLLLVCERCVNGWCCMGTWVHGMSVEEGNAPCVHGRMA